MRLLTALSLTVLFSACAVAPEIDSCDGAVKNINITYNETNNMVKIQVAPKRAEVDPDDILRFKISGNLAKTVTFQGKTSDPDASWITGSATGGSVWLCVPKDAPRNKIYTYQVDVEDIGYLDPEVRIRN